MNCWETLRTLPDDKIVTPLKPKYAIRINMTKLHHLLFGIFIVAIANNQIDLPQRVIKMLKY